MMYRGDQWTTEEGDEILGESEQSMEDEAKSQRAKDRNIKTERVPLVCSASSCFVVV